MKIDTDPSRFLGFPFHFSGFFLYSVYFNILIDLYINFCLVMYDIMKYGVTARTFMLLIEGFSLLESLDFI